MIKRSEYHVLVIGIFSILAMLTEGDVILFLLGFIIGYHIGMYFWEVFREVKGIWKR